jgi:hypothetical protein|tara:strand:- start:941 stop:1756 length:816 start_codon:yes stop_codon:yes gene_type:complete
MKNLKYLLPLFLLFTFVFISCEEEEDPVAEEEIVVNSTSIIPSSTRGRSNTVLGCIEIDSRITTIEVWDHGQIDGDIVSIIANDETIIDEVELDGPDNPIIVDYDFSNNGFNYVTLYAHNLGDIPPNTCTIAINGEEFVLAANQDANGAVNVVVTGYDVFCSDAGGNNGGGNGDDGNDDDDDGSGTGDFIFWTNQDYGCGNISVSVDGIGSSTIDGYFDSATPDCSNTSAGGNFNNIPIGSYSFTASCSDYNWSGSFTVTEDTCNRLRLTL